MSFAWVPGARGLRVSRMQRDPAPYVLLVPEARAADGSYRRWEVESFFGVGDARAVVPADEFEHFAGAEQVVRVDLIALGPVGHARIIEGWARCCLT